MNAQLEAFKNRALESLSKVGLSVSEIQCNVCGELHEASYNDISFFYGNGELIACNDNYSVTFLVDVIGFYPTLHVYDYEELNEAA